jgi:hypothetical protein
MIKYYCDRCKNEASVNRLSYSVPVPVPGGPKELCVKCHHQLIKLVREFLNASR